MADALSKSFGKPDNVVEFPRIKTRIVELGDLTVGELVSDPGWRWSEDVRPDGRGRVVPGEACRVRRLRPPRRGLPRRHAPRARPRRRLRHPAGPRRLHARRRALRAGRMDGHQGLGRLPHGDPQPRARHDSLDRPRGTRPREPAELGDARWRQLLSDHFEAARAELERFGGREIATTGDGMLATFDGPASALHCAAAVRRRARSARAPGPRGRARRRGRAGRAGRPRGDRARGRADHGGRRRRRDPRVRHDARARRSGRPLVRGPRYADVQGARRRVASRRVPRRGRTSDGSDAHRPGRPAADPLRRLATRTLSRASRRSSSATSATTASCAGRRPRRRWASSRRCARGAAGSRSCWPLTRPRG